MNTTPTPTPGENETTDVFAPHHDGERFSPNPRHALRLAIVIDTNEREEYPDNPYTLNAWLTDPLTTLAGPDLLVRGEGCLIEGTISQQLRDLADAIEDGAVFL